MRKHTRLRLLCMLTAVLVLCACIPITAYADHGYDPKLPKSKTYTLRYDANGGVNAPSEQSYTTDKLLEQQFSHPFRISEQKPTREGYWFMGWGETPNGRVKYYPSSNIWDSYIWVEKTTTLYAVWMEDKCPTGTPAPTGTTEPTGTPAPTDTTEPTGTPAPTDTTEPTGTPEPTDTTEPTGTPAPTDTTEPTGTPVPTDTTEPTGTPEPTDTTEPTGTPEPTGTTEPTGTPEPTETIEPTNTPEPSHNPTPTPSQGTIYYPDYSEGPAATPAPTAQPGDKWGDDVSPKTGAAEASIPALMLVALAAAASIVCCLRKRAR